MGQISLARWLALILAASIALDGCATSAPANTPTSEPRQDITMAMSPAPTETYDAILRPSMPPVPATNMVKAATASKISVDQEPVIFLKADSSAAKYGVIGDLSWSPDGTLLAAISGDKIDVWDVTNSASRAVFMTQPVPPLPLVFSLFAANVSFSPNGKMLASGVDWDNKHSFVTIWDVNTKSKVKDIPEADYVVWSPDGNQFVTSSRHAQQLTFWGRATFQKEGQVDGIVSDVSWSPDSTTLAAVGSDGQVLIFDLDANRISVRFPSHWGSVMRVLWAATGDKLAVAAGGHLTIWDLANLSKSFDLDMVEIFSDSALTYQGDASPLVYDSSWSSNGSMVAVATANYIIIARGDTGQIVKVHIEHGEVSALAFSPTQDLLAYGTQDGGVKILKMPY